jgi:hypothetical protein
MYHFDPPFPLQEIWLAFLILEIYTTHLLVVLKDTDRLFHFTTSFV